MKKIRQAIALALGLLSAYMILAGLVVFLSTSAGVVQGSEFGMLITLANQISLIVIWLALFALWKLVAMGKSISQE